MNGLFISNFINAQEIIIGTVACHPYSEKNIHQIGILSTVFNLNVKLTLQCVKVALSTHH